jgi:hypothetical protein
MWLMFLIAVSAVHVSTLTISPTIWQDEVQMIEFGRTVVFERGTQWSFHSLERGGTVPLYGFVGPMLQEATIQIFGPAPVWPRAMTLLGACLGASCLVAWLHIRGLRKWWALGLGACFLLDPLFVSGYRGARADCWAFAALFASCWCLRRAVVGEPYWFGILSGALCVGGCFVWPTAIISMLVVPLEGWFATQSVVGPQARRIVSRALYGFLLGATAVGLLGLFTIVQLEPRFAYVIGFMTRSRLDPANVTAIAVLKAAFASVTMSPFFWATTFLAAFLCRPFALVPLGLACALVVLSGTVYVHRVVYIMPGAILVIAEALRGERRRAPNLLRAALAVTVVWGVALSLVVRPVMALSSANARDPGLILAFAKRTVGDGPRKVYVEPWEFYYAGRQLHWAMFHVFPGEADRNRKLLASTAEYTIVRSDQIGEVKNWNLGLELKGVSPFVAPGPLGGAHYDRYAVFRMVSATEKR